MRAAVLPRDVAARVITSAVARSFGAVNAACFALSIPMLAEYAAMHQLGPISALPYFVLVVLLGASTAMTIKPTRIVLAVYLVLGTIGAVVFQVSLIAARPEVITEALFLYNRPTTALVLAGVTASTVRAGMAWALVGFGLSTAVTATSATLTATPFAAGYGPILTLSLAIVVYGALALIQSSLRRRLPDFEHLEEQARRGALTESLRDRMTAVVHDTLLNDLSLVMNAPDELDERMRSRLREDLDTLTGAEWLRETEEVAVDERDAEVHNRVMQVISDLQWRGLTVHVTGSRPDVWRLAAGAPDVIVDVVRASLENVLRHSGTTVAELDLGGTADEFTFIVSDQGAGFDPASIPADRLGIRHSIIERVRAVGGSVKIWSTPGDGTSVVVRVPSLARASRLEGAGRGAE